MTVGEALREELVMEVMGGQGGDQILKDSRRRLSANQYVITSTL